MAPRAAIFALSVFAAVAASPLHIAHDHAPAKRALPALWYRAPDHPLGALFARDTPAVGSPAWLAQYPDEYGKPDYAPDALPASWLAAYNTAVAAGNIPSIPPSMLVPGQNPVYPAGFDASGPVVCSGTPKCRAPGDVWDAPTGVIGLGFDDGPTDASPGLYGFLQQNNQIATHFMIGRNIAQRPQVFLQAFGQGQDIAVHTWSHPYMTTLNDSAVVAELGWTMQIIYDSSGGRIPRFWRPPYGDADNRVRAIAQHVFGLTTVWWNQDSEDWSLEETPPLTTPAAITANVHSWLSGAHTPGLIILEHELGNDTIGIYEQAVFPLIAQFGWTAKSIPAMLALPTYQNAVDDNSTVTSMSFALAPSTTSTSTSSSASGAASASVSASDSHHVGKTGGVLPRTRSGVLSTCIVALTLAYIFFAA